jgi:2-polyprenyl-6-methoxyphenol hydroxylase-like FAD-dependent oxidoreductase
MGLLLHQHKIPFTIFELRNKPTDKELAKPSGMLDLHEESGLAVLKECGLYDDFLPLTGECTEDFIVAKKDGNVLFTAEGGNSRPEISRNNLTKLLLRNLPAENIKWDHRLFSATAAPDHSSTELDFGTHGKHIFDLVIGADGAWSKVRAALTDLKPRYTGMQNITLTIKHITKKYPQLAKLVGSGTFSALGNGHAVLSQRGPMDSARIYVWFSNLDEDFASASGLAGNPASSAKEKLIQDEKLLGTFGPVIKELVATACDEEAADNPDSTLDIRALHKIPHGSAWEHRPGLTLVGDAAHLMLPNGEGVNFAMLDSLLLSQAIVKAHANGADGFQSAFDPLLKEFETSLVERAKKIGEETDGLIGMMFGGEDAAEGFAKFFRDMVEQAKQ